MNISIKVIKRTPEVLDRVKSCWGKIFIGEDFEEKFLMPLNYWKLEDYERQWQEGLTRIKNKDTSCLVTVAQNIKLNQHCMFWVMYKDLESKKIYIREQIVIDLSKNLKNKGFTPETCYEFVKPRKGFDPNVSEWEIDIE